MTCEELRDDYELYALGTLEGEERDEISRHGRVTIKPARTCRG